MRVVVFLLCLFVLVAVQRPPQSTFDAELDSIVQGNKDRLGDAKVAVGFIYFFVFVEMMALLVLAGTLQGWLIAPIKTQKRRGLLNALLWVCMFGVVYIGCTWGAGFPGWLALGFLLFLQVVIVSIVYFCIRRRHSLTNVAPEDGADKAAETSDDGFNVRPLAMGKAQKGFVIGSLLVIAIGFIALLGLGFGWQPKAYHIWDPEANARLEEYQPSLVAKSTLAMYAHDRMAALLELDFFTKYLTAWCGPHYRVELDEAKKKELIDDAFIQKYEIDMTPFAKCYRNGAYLGDKCYLEYSSVNDWFIRGLTDTARPVNTTNTDAVLSPADARVMVFKKTMDDVRIWIKGDGFTLSTLLNSDALATEFHGSSMAIIRLAPQDYHRFHFPFGGTVDHLEEISSTILSVNADAVTSDNLALLNSRKVTVINSGDPVLGRFVYITIGATCVGSVILNYEVGDTVERGAEAGFMQFGGSTVIMLFKANSVDFEEYLVYNARKPVETLLKTNVPVASIRRTPTTTRKHRDMHIQAHDMELGARCVLDDDEDEGADGLGCALHPPKATKFIYSGAAGTIYM